MVALFDQYRPRVFAEVVGQAAAVKQVQAVLARGWGGRAWWITGDSGTGKTTIARVIAAQGASEFGTEELDAQSLTVAKLREIERDMAYRVMGALPGRCYIVNESHGLRRDTIRQLLVMLERLPDYVVWVFTTTKAGEARLFEHDDAGDATPLLSRCVEITLCNDAASQAAFADYARKVAVQEGIDGLDITCYRRAVESSKGNLRRVLQRIESGGFKADAKAVLEREFEMCRATKGPHGERRRAELQAAIAKCV